MPDLTDLSKIRLATVDQLWRESRQYQEKAIGQLILVASGAIIISISALNPLLTITPKLQQVWSLILSWALLMLSILLGVLARFRLGEHTRNIGEAVHGNVTDTNASDRRMKKTVRKMWSFFLVGLALLLFFIGSNLLSPDKPDDGSATSQQTTIVDEAMPSGHEQDSTE